MYKNKLIIQIGSHVGNTMNVNSFKTNILINLINFTNKTCL